MSKPTPEEAKLRGFIGSLMFGAKYYDYVLTPPTNPPGKYPRPDAIEEHTAVMKRVHGFINAEVLAALQRIEYAGTYAALQKPDALSVVGAYDRAIEQEKQRYGGKEQE